MNSDRLAHSKITKKFRTDDRQLLFSRGEGGMVWDALGRSYLDFVMGYGPVIIGHADKEYNARICEQLGHGMMMPGYSEFHERYLDHMLRDRPGDRGAFFKTASEAVTAALRLAAMENGRLGVIRTGYVGWHDSQVANSLKWHEPQHSPFREQLRYTQAMRGVGAEEPALNWVDLRLESLGALLDQHRGRLGCFIFDAYLADRTSAALLSEALAMCRDAGLLTVFDETKTGGRISPLGYAHDHALAADMIVLGKALANGAPISVLVGNRELMAHAEQARLSGTFSKEMVTVYAAKATTDILERPIGESASGWEELGRIGTAIAATFTAAATECGVADAVRAEPVLGGGMFELVYGDAVLGSKQARSALLQAFSGEGILLLEGHPSFVCLAHRAIDHDDLRGRVACAFESWAVECEVQRD
ncbi:MAG: aminotransferase class III-fold pyridoxal phosphate-dependent enzyme [Sphingomonas sp.]|nr:MAG: aminotransferase class III-fold pyridoxal phosphate-dependent enzyme [Sphingomonas sp.]